MFASALSSPPLLAFCASSTLTLRSFIPSRALAHSIPALRPPRHAPRPRSRSTRPVMTITPVAATAATAATTLSALRARMAHLGITAFIVPSADAHNSEYTAPCFARRAFVSGFSGSAGTALVTDSAALLWTDGRYFLQAATQLDPDHWTLMRSGVEGTPTLPDYLATLSGVVGIDPELHSADFVAALRARGINVHLLPNGVNPVDDVWPARPAPPSAPLRVHPMSVAGTDPSTKLDALRTAMSARGAAALVMSMLDEVAWLLNVRGADIPHCPVALAYAAVTHDDATLFVDADKLTPDVRAHLAAHGVTTRPYTDALPAVEDLAAAGNGPVWLDGATASAAMAAAAGDTAVLDQTPVPLAKAVKNEAELSGMRAAHVTDAVALCAFLRWLEVAVTDEAQQPLSEAAVGDALLGFRAARPGFMGPSFDTIAGYAANGAIIHYRAEHDDCANLGTDAPFLLDSGGQYDCGTTDVTRTLHFGDPTPEQRAAFTRVLQGHIALDAATFPRGTTGLALDTLARRPLWDAGLDYRHGTGHGVGACLNVHEGPQSIAARPASAKVALAPGMIVSNEPGYYEDGNFGIRIENLVIVTEKTTQHTFGGKPFLGFERLTCVPIDKRLIDTKLMTDKEVVWLNDYHKEVRAKLVPVLEKEGMTDVLDWLSEKTSPL